MEMGEVRMMMIELQNLRIRVDLSRAIALKVTLILILQNNASPVRCPPGF